MAFNGNIFSRISSLTNNWHSSATLTEVSFPCFFLSCEAEC